jgi:branched-chain amino acid transport system substrate-binding protein
MRRVALLASLLLLAVACGGGEGGGGGGPKANLGTVKVGAVMPLSGSVASSGQDALNGVMLAQDILNGKYPNIDLPKLTVGKVQVVSGDTQGDAQTGASEATRLIQSEKVVALTGAFQSAVTITASQVAERQGVPFVNGSSSSTALTERGYKWFWRVGPSDKTFATTFFDFLKSIAGEHPVKKMVIINENDQFGNDGAKVIQQLSANYSITIVDSIVYPFNATDLTSQIQKMRTDQPDAVFVFAFINDLTLMLKTMAQLNYTPPALLGFGAGFVDPKFVQNLGTKTEYSITRAAWSLEITQKNPTAKAVADVYKQRFNQEMTENSARDFEAMYTLGMAIESAGSTDPAKIQAALNKSNITKTIMGWPGIKFGADGQNSQASGIIQQMTGGQYHVLFPQNVASAKVVWPIPSLSGR